MNPTLTYQVNKGIFIKEENIFLHWNIDRNLTRALFNHKFEASDNILDLSAYNNGDSSQNIIQRRDIYESYQNQNNLFFLNFDKSDHLTEIEIHYGFNINIENIIIDFSMDIELIVNLLSNISSNKIELSAEEYFFKDLKLIIASGNAMGGNDKNLSYFYCGNDLSHLNE